MTHDELRALAEAAKQRRSATTPMRTSEVLALLDEIDALRTNANPAAPDGVARALEASVEGNRVLAAERDRYREALEEIADALPSNGSITVRSIISRVLSETGEQK